MNWWRRLKTWQKWGIVFGATHVFFYSSIFLLVLFNCKVIGNCEGGLLLVLFEYPLYAIVQDWPMTDKNYVFITLFYFPVLGTFLWGLVGCAWGWFVDFYKRLPP